jgi:hypothetical protein
MSVAPDTAGTGPAVHRDPVTWLPGGASAVGALLPPAGEDVEVAPDDRWVEEEQPAVAKVVKAIASTTVVDVLSFRVGLTGR